MLQALAHHAHGDRPAALTALSRSLVQAPEPGSCVRVYLDEGAPMLALLRDVAGSAREHAVSDREGDGHAAQGQVRGLLHRATSPAPEPQQLPLTDPLSQR